MVPSDRTGAGGALGVVVVNHTSAISGAEVSLLDLIGGLTVENRVTVAVPEGPLAAGARECGAAVEIIPAVEGSLRLHPLHTPGTVAAMAGAARAIRRITRASGAEVVHANSFRAGLVASLAARFGAPRPLVHLHDCLPPTAAANLTERVLSRNARMILANSRYTAECFNGGASRAPMEVVHNPIDLHRFDPANIDREEARHELGLAKDQTVLTVLAQITPWKGQDTAVEAVRLLRERGRDVRLLVAGEVKFRRPLTRYDNDSYLRELQERVRSVGLEDSVTFTGQCRDAPRLLRAVDFVLVPSWAEPWGRVVVEAMAMGTPVVATSVGGTRELIDDGQDGFLAPPRDPAAWASAIERVMDDSDLRERVVTAGLLTARRFRADTYVDEIVRLYRDSIGMSQ